MTPPAFPAGEYVPEFHPTPARRAELIAEIEALPAKVRALVAGLTATQLDTKYKNWTVRQIVHHLPDSHVNAYVRVKLTLTEDRPTIRPYDETRWSELPDARTADIELSLKLLEAVHARWVPVLRAMTDADFEREYVHPEYGKTFRLAEAIGMYAHHGRHHAAQIAWVKGRHGW
jgi:pterin-4a-carbinolamine dehydratase